jgi:hypothetical protein
MTNLTFVTLEILTEVTEEHDQIVWNVLHCTTLTELYQGFGGMCCLLLQNRRIEEYADYASK